MQVAGISDGGFCDISILSGVAFWAKSTVGLKNDVGINEFSITIFQVQKATLFFLESN